MIAALLLGAPCAGSDAGPSGGLELRGLSPEQAARSIAETLCAWYTECGRVETSCDVNDEGLPVCTAVIVPVDYADCVGEMQPEVLVDLQCVEPTDSEYVTIATCVDAMVAFECLTQEQVDANAAAIAAGEPEPYAQTLPPDCDEMASLFSRCNYAQ